MLFGDVRVAGQANVLTPRSLAIAAVELASEHGSLECKCMGPIECEKLGMGAYLGVAQGASQDNEAQFIHLTYKRGVPKTKLAIVGKGLTYDSGGYNLKPSAGGMIELMKFDMGGRRPASVSRSRRWRPTVCFAQAPRRRSAAPRPSLRWRCRTVARRVEINGNARDCVSAQARSTSSSPRVKT